MESINRQLHIDVPKNPNIPSRYTRGLYSVQPQLISEDWSLDFYNDIDALDNWGNANGDRDISDEILELDEVEYSEFLGIGYPTCLIARCKMCKSECKDKQGLKWGKGGKSCYKQCIAKYIADKKTADNAILNTATPSATPDLSKGAPEGVRTGMSRGAKIGLAVGVVAALGLVTYLVVRKRG